MSLFDPSQARARRVMIASANPLFARGLQKMVAQHWEGRPAEVRLAGTMQEAVAALESWQPDLIIVDFDEVGSPGSIRRGAFLDALITGNRPMQVMLVSLRESGEVVVYDRRTLTPDQAETWLDLPWPSSPEVSTPAAVPARSTGPVQNNPVNPEAGQPAALPARQIHPRRGGMKHYVIPGILTVIFTAVLGFVLQNIGLLPAAASVQAGPVDGMIHLQVWIISFLFSLIVVFMVYSFIVFGRRKQASAYFKNSDGLEVLWTVIPLGVVIALSFVGARDLAQIRQPEANALEVKVTAFQWGWSFEYPDSGVTGGSLYLPVNRQVHLVMTSRDVIHSFWVPEFRVKQDILPGANLVKELRITPTKTGNYTVYCNQLCGGSHAYMTAPVKVVSAQEFDAWIATQSAASNLPPEQLGQKLANACTGCHSLDGSKLVGPSWKGLYGSQVELASGSSVTADDQYLHDSIVDPNKQVVAGFPAGVMPQDYKTQFNDKQISAIIAFIKTFK